MFGRFPKAAYGMARLGDDVTDFGDYGFEDYADPSSVYSDPFAPSSIPLQSTPIGSGPAPAGPLTYYTPPTYTPPISAGGAGGAGGAITQQSPFSMSSVSSISNLISSLFGGGSSVARAPSGPMYSSAPLPATAAAKGGITTTQLLLIGAAVAGVGYLVLRNKRRRS